MPKRRMHKATAAQKAAAKKNLERARAAKRRANGKVPTGKTSLLFHATSKKGAEAIVKEQHIRHNPIANRVFFRSPHETKLSGSSLREAVVGVKVKRKLVETRETFGGPEHGKKELVVHPDNLKGVKIRRIK